MDALLKDTIVVLHDFNLVTHPPSSDQFSTALMILDFLFYSSRFGAMHWMVLIVHAIFLYLSVVNIANALRMVLMKASTLPPVSISVGHGLGPFWP